MVVFFSENLPTSQCYRLELKFSSHYAVHGLLEYFLQGVMFPVGVLIVLVGILVLSTSNKEADTVDRQMEHTQIP